MVAWSETREERCGNGFVDEFCVCAADNLPAAEERVAEILGGVVTYRDALTIWSRPAVAEQMGEDVDWDDPINDHFLAELRISLLSRWRRFRLTEVFETAQAALDVALDEALDTLVLPVTVRADASVEQALPWWKRVCWRSTMLATVIATLAASVIDEFDLFKNLIDRAALLVH